MLVLVLVERKREMRRVGFACSLSALIAKPLKRGRERERERLKLSKAATGCRRLLDLTIDQIYTTYGQI